MLYTEICMWFMLSYHDHGRHITRGQCQKNGKMNVLLTFWGDITPGLALTTVALSCIEMHQQSMLLSTTFYAHCTYLSIIIY